MFSDRFGTATVEPGPPGIPGVCFYTPRSALVAAPRRNENRFSVPAGAVFPFFCLRRQKTADVAQNTGGTHGLQNRLHPVRTTPRAGCTWSESRHTTHAF
jgi:hypothetical protein